jgi:hypothetical protein
MGLYYPRIGKRSDDWGTRRREELNRIAAQMRARNAGRISQREHALRQRRTADGRRFA